MGTYTGTRMCPFPHSHIRVLRDWSAGLAALVLGESVVAEYSEKCFFAGLTQGTGPLWGAQLSLGAPPPRTGFP